MGIAHDIPERKRLEGKRAEDLLQAAPDAVVVVDQSRGGILIFGEVITKRKQMESNSRV